MQTEIACDNDAIGRVVALTGEARKDRDDRGQFCIYDENFVRRHADGHVETHALWVANPPIGRILPACCRTRPALFNWEVVFDDEPDIDGVTEDERYDEISPYDQPRHAGRPVVPCDSPAAKSEAGACVSPARCGLVAPLELRNSGVAVQRCRSAKFRGQ